MKKGYTLIEILVAIFIFSILALALVESFVSASRAQRKALAETQVINSTSYVLEYMSRALRMAKRGDGSCVPTDRNYATDTNSITFRNYNDKCQTFFLENGMLKEKIDTNDSILLTPGDLEILNIKFDVFGDEIGKQPLVKISFQIQKRDQPETKIEIQTAVSQRNLNVQQPQQ
jgi:prepilin-type N-terminal cleavage/methylation domain-containing protein